MNIEIDMLGDHGIKKKNMMTKEQKRILISYFLDNIKHPYVNNQTKKELMSETGLKVDQIANWFMNVRKRLWLPTLRKNRNITQKRLREMIQLKFEQDILEQYVGNGPEYDIKEEQVTDLHSKPEPKSVEDDNPMNFTPSLKLRKREHKMQEKIKARSSESCGSPHLKERSEDEADDDWKQSQIEFFEKHNNIQVGQVD